MVSFLSSSKWLSIAWFAGSLMLVQESYSFNPSLPTRWALGSRPRLATSPRMQTTAEYMDALKKTPEISHQESISRAWLASRGEGQDPESRIPPSWLLSKGEFSNSFKRYASIMRKEGSGFDSLTPQESRFITPHMQRQRQAAAADAEFVNTNFFETLTAHIPTYETMMQNLETRGAHEAEPWSAGAFHPPAPVVDIFHPPGIELDKKFYASFGSICLHLFRDWSCQSSHVQDTVYRPIVEELKRRVPIPEHGPPPRVLVPGAALCRLPFELMMEGYEVECNEYSAMFVNVVDFLFNTCQAPQSLYPLAHLFADNRQMSTQYMKLQVPERFPLAEATRAGRKMTLSAGDFVQLYKQSGPAHREFDAVLTCFFIDTGDHILDYVETIDGVLKEGGHWINLGPLHYDASVRLKLTWEELQSVWQGIGYDFLSVAQKYSAYYLQPGVKLSTEQFDSVFSTAVKRRQ